jgi:anti-sigma B factor antagonist
VGLRNLKLRGDNELEISTNTSNHDVIITLVGSMYVEDAAVLREKLMTFIESGYKQFIIKLHEVEYIDSSGLGVLVAMQKKLLPKEGTVVLVGAKGVVKELFELTRLNKVFTMQP